MQAEYAQEQDNFILRYVSLQPLPQIYVGLAYILLTVLLTSKVDNDQL